MVEMKLNKRLIRRMIKRFEATPESYDQGTFGQSGVRDNRPPPVCGTTACLAGQAIICSEHKTRDGIKKLFKLLDSGARAATTEAARVMGITEAAEEALFYTGLALTWPEPYSTQWLKAKTYKGQASAAINLLRAILRTDGKILEG